MIHERFPRRARRARRGLALAMLLAATAACHDKDPVGPAAPLRLDVRLTTPNAREAGVLLHFTGAIDSITTSGGRTATLVAGSAASRQANAHVVVRGDLTSGVIATVWTRRGGHAPTVALQQAVAPTTLAQRVLAGYSVTLAAR